MDGYSTVTQKGQVAIPKGIRDYLHLKPSDRVHFSVKDNKIIAEPIHSVDSMRGFIKTKRVVSKKAMKETIAKAVVEKYARRS